MRIWSVVEALLTLVPRAVFNVLVLYNHLPAPTKARETSDVTLLSLIMTECLDEKRKSERQKTDDDRTCAL